ncbi:response regulator [Candidatus Poribacteria bacterium]|nr:response regulator [Candidatus Poribacteria bacterium]
MNVNQMHQTPAKILIVDDSPANLNMLSDTLEPEGYNILIAASGEVALKIAARASPDLILLDVLMPGIDGFETGRRLKGEVPTADIPVLFVTAKGVREDLYFRLDRFTVTVPPLRERKEDLPLLATHFLKMFAAEMGIGRPGNPEIRKAGEPDNGLPLTTSLSPEALEALMNYHFPGNIRELKNIIERALILSRGSEIQLNYLEHLHFIKVSERPPTAQPTLPPQTVGHPEFIGEAQPPQDRRQIEVRVLRRAQARDAGKKTASSPETDLDTSAKDEGKILVYLRAHESLSNEECRDLLNVDLHRASYLLRKLHRYGLLVREGERRWSRYRLP